MSNRKDVTKIILPEMNKTYVPAVPILSSQEEMDIAKKNLTVSQNMVLETPTLK